MLLNFGMREVKIKESNQEEVTAEAVKDREGVIKQREGGEKKKEGNGH
jgi:hypothetical protein